ncbi:MAG: hypothetical protein P8Z30_15725 [Acidobacteriota bacterium]
MRKGEFLISAMLALAVFILVLGLQRNWHPSGLKEAATSAERYMLGKNSEYRAALYRSDSVSLGFAPGRLVIYNSKNQIAYRVDTLEGARDAWTAIYDFAGRHGLPARNRRPRPDYLRTLTGDRKPDMVIGLYSGGNRCCTTVNVLEVETDSLKVIGHIEGLNGWPFEGLEIRRIGPGPVRELVAHRPQVTACGSREEAADVIKVYAYSDGQYKDETSKFPDFLQGVLRQNLAMWSREKTPSLGLLQTLAAQYGVLGQPDRGKNFFAQNLDRFLPQMKEQGFDAASCKEDLDSLVDRLANPQSQ